MINEDNNVSKLRELYKSKIILEKFKEENELTKPLVIEFCGLPYTGKTSSFNELYNLLSTVGFSVRKISDDNLNFNGFLNSSELINLSSLDDIRFAIQIFNEGIYNAEQKQFDVVLLDEGLIDKYFQLQVLRDNFKISSMAYDSVFSKLNYYSTNVDALFVLTASANEIIKRKEMEAMFKNHSFNGFDNYIDRLSSSYNKVSKKIDGNVCKIDSSNLSLEELSTVIVGEAIETYQRKLKNN